MLRSKLATVTNYKNTMKGCVDNFTIELANAINQNNNKNLRLFKYEK